MKMKSNLRSSAQTLSSKLFISWMMLFILNSSFAGAQTGSTGQSTLPLPEGISKSSTVDWTRVKEPVLLADFKEQIKSIAFSPDGSLLVIGIGWKTPSIVLWDLKKQKEVHRFSNFGNDLSVDSLAFTPNGYYFISHDSSGLIRRWDLKSKKQTSHIQLTQKIKLAYITISGDGKWLAVHNMANSPIRLINLQSMEFIGELKSTIFPPGVHFSSDSRYLLITDLAAVMAYEINTGVQKKLLTVEVKDKTSRILSSWVSNNHIYVAGSIALQKWDYVKKQLVWSKSLPDRQTQRGPEAQMTVFGDVNAKADVMVTTTRDAEIVFLKLSTGEVINKISVTNKTPVGFMSFNVGGTVLLVYGNGTSLWGWF
jgi:WD40 repeat protein